MSASIVKMLKYLIARIESRLDSVDNRTYTLDFEKEVIIKALKFI